MDGAAAHCPNCDVALGGEQRFCGACGQRTRPRAAHHARHRPRFPARDVPRRSEHLRAHQGPGLSPRTRGARIRRGQTQEVFRAIRVPGTHRGSGEFPDRGHRRAVGHFRCPEQPGQVSAAACQSRHPPAAAPAGGDLCAVVLEGTPALRRTSHSRGLYIRVQDSVAHAGRLADRPAGQGAILGRWFHVNVLRFMAGLLRVRRCAVFIVVALSRSCCELHWRRSWARR